MLNLKIYRNQGIFMLNREDGTELALTLREMDAIFLAQEKENRRAELAQFMELIEMYEDRTYGFVPEGIRLTDEQYETLLDKVLPIYTAIRTDELEKIWDKWAEEALRSTFSEVVGLNAAG